jgi:rhodanese-related sulfurtransferase
MRNPEPGDQAEVQPAPAEHGRVLRDAALVLLISALAALGVNAVRPNGIPLLAAQPYETLVPCPEPGGEVVAVAASDPRLRDGGTLVVDARSAAEYQAGHFEGSVHAAFDWLAELDEIRPVVRNLAKQAARRQRVVVYGDGGDPDTGLEWAKLLAAEGIKHVHYVQGGAPALMGKPPSRRDGAP